MIHARVFNRCFFLFRLPNDKIAIYVIVKCERVLPCCPSEPKINGASLKKNYKCGLDEIRIGCTSTSQIIS